MKVIKKYIIYAIFFTAVLWLHSISSTTTATAAENNTTSQNKSEIKEKIPVKGHFILEKNDQNPFDQQKELCFKLLKPGNVKLTIYHIDGREIRSIISNYFETGNHDFVWDGNDNSGNPVKSGVYRYSLRVQDFEQSHLIAYLR